MLETRASETRHGGRTRSPGWSSSERGGGPVAIPAAAVVLASGGYEWNATLRTRFLPGPLTHPHSPPANDGDGLLMAMDVGADLANMNETWWYPASLDPRRGVRRPSARPLRRVERTAPHSIIVEPLRRALRQRGRQLQRHDEGVLLVRRQRVLAPAPALLGGLRPPVPVALPGGDGPARRPRSATGCWCTTPSTAWPARSGIDPVGLADTVERWNRFVRDGRDRDFGRGSSAYDRFHGDPVRRPTPTWAPSRRDRSTPCPSTSARSAPRADHGSTPTAGSCTCGTVPSPVCTAPGNVIASPAGPAYYGGGTSIGMGMVWGHLAGTHAAGVRRPPAAGGRRERRRTAAGSADSPRSGGGCTS